MDREMLIHNTSSYYNKVLFYYKYESCFLNDYANEIYEVLKLLEVILLIISLSGFLHLNLHENKANYLVFFEFYPLLFAQKYRFN